MSETKQVVRYDYNYLQQYCKENGIELLKDYSTEKVNRDTIIEAKCLTENCNNNVCKDFRAITKFGGCYCINCCINNSNEQRKTTCLKKYGNECALQNPDIKEKAKQTMVNKYGVAHTFQSSTLFEKFKNTMNDKYGCNYSFESIDLTKKIRKTMIDKYGFSHPMQINDIKDKIKQTNLEKYGVENCMMSKDIKEKAKQTNLEKYGVEHPQQNAEVAEKSAKNAYKSKEYIFPSGKIERIQGYEHYMLNELLQQENILETDIIVSRKDVPTIWYEDANGKKHRYFVDCFIKSQNRCIESKSTWTAQKKKDYIFLKQQALKNAGYKCEIWVYNSKGEKVECYK